MCIMAGCDFVPSLQGVAARKAHAHIKKYKNFVKVRLTQQTSLALCASRAQAHVQPVYMHNAIMKCMLCRCARCYASQGQMSHGAMRSACSVRCGCSSTSGSTAHAHGPACMCSRCHQAAWGLQMWTCQLRCPRCGKDACHMSAPLCMLGHCTVCAHDFSVSAFTCPC